MEIISNKDICNLLTNTLKLIDKSQWNTVQGLHIFY